MTVTARRVRDGDFEGYLTATETGIDLEEDRHVEVLDGDDIFRAPENLKTWLRDDLEARKINQTLREKGNTNYGVKAPVSTKFLHAQTPSHTQKTPKVHKARYARY